MKKSNLFLCFILALAALPMSVSGQLTIWSFTDELANINNYYKRSHPGVRVEYSQIPSDQFQAKLDPVLAFGQGVPDIIALESAFVRKYVESGLLLDLTDVYEANKGKLLSYPVEIGTYNGKVYAMSWQACPGAMFYRRSLAIKYLGTDDPKTVQTYFSDFNKFLETARLLKQKSNGSCVVVSSLDDLFIPFLSARKTPWLVNDKLVIDPVMEQYMDLCRTMHDNRLDGRVGMWSEGWFAGMRSELRDENGRPAEVFSYFMPTWGLQYVLKTNTPSTSGDWAMIQGPSSWRWGGTWIGAYKGTKNAAAVKEFIRYATTDDAFLEAWAKDTGDMVGNINVINKIKNNYREPYLKGQNHYAEFADMAKNVNGRLFQETDEEIESMFEEAAYAFINGDKTKTQALADFRRKVESAFTPSQNALSGTYRFGENAYITFNGSAFSGLWNKTTPMSGTYSLLKNKLTLKITSGPKASSTWIWTVVNINTFRDQDGDIWNKEGTSTGSFKTSGQLVIWSFTDELNYMTTSPTWGFKATHPGVNVEYSQTPSDQFQSKLDPVLASGRGAPDIIALESAFVRKYVESGLLLDITDIYEANKNKLLAYPVEVGTYNGRVYALSWQSCPGTMFYRRSLAKKYLGTDDPKIVQTYFNNFNKFLETAKLLKDKSNGSCVVVSSLGDIRNPSLAVRKSPWVVNGKLVIDPAMEQYMDICKTLHDNRWEGRVGQWSEGWFYGMKGELRDEFGKPLEVFSYFMPTWGLHYVLKTNAPSTSGDWAMIQGPSSWRWGGTWVGAYKGTKNVAAVKEFIRYVTTDDAFLEAWAKDTGDMVASLNVINKIKDTYTEPYLGGQNHYSEFAEMAKRVNGKLDQKSDEAIEAMFDEAVAAFVNGEKTKAQALADFRRQAEWYIR